MKKSMRMIVFLCLMAGITGCAAIVGEPLPDDELMASPDADFPLDFYMEGQPNEGLFNAEGGYFLWRNNNVFSVRISKQGFAAIFPPGPMFTGAIRASRGMILSVRRYNLAAPDHVKYAAGNVDFRLELRDEVSGFDFEVEPIGIEYCVTFDLRYNGMAAPQMVHLGPTMFIPATMPISVCVR